MAELSLVDSRKVLDNVTRAQAKQIKDLYAGTLTTVQKQLKSLEGLESKTAGLQRARLTQLQHELNSNLSRASAKLEQIISGNMTTVSSAVFADNAKFLEKVGMKLTGSLASVPADVVASIKTGKVYDGNWSLSKAIWAQDKKSKDAINDIIARGVANNQSAFDIGKQLEKYVDPAAVKDWKWNKVYPNSGSHIDYNAQRLSRTMVTHAHEQSVVRAVKDNPFCTGIEWQSAHSDRVCPICLERNGVVYKKEELPMDHPNGMCTWIPVIPDDYDAIAERIGNWYEEGNDPDLDAFAKSLGHQIEEPAKGLKATLKPVTPAITPTPTPTPTQQTKVVGRIDGKTLDEVKALTKKEKLNFLKPHVSLPELDETKKVKDIDKMIDRVYKRKTITTKSTTVPKTLENIDDNAAKYIEKTVTEANAKKVETITDNLSDAIDSASLKIRVKDKEAMESILEEGRFKSQFETGKSSGEYDLDIRKQATQRLFGADTDALVNKDYEIYGYLWDDAKGIDSGYVYGQSKAASYGRITVTLKDDLRERTTMTIGDSLMPSMNNNIAASRLDKITKCWSDSYGNIENDLYKIQKANMSTLRLNDLNIFNNADYVEAQFHGGVATKDIAYVVVDASKSGSNYLDEYKNIIRLCKEKDIDIGFIRMTDLNNRFRSAKNTQIIWAD